MFPEQSGITIVDVNGSLDELMIMIVVIVLRNPVFFPIFVVIIVKEWLVGVVFKLGILIGAQPSDPDRNLKS